MPQIVNVAHAQEPDIRELAELIAERHDFPVETLKAVVDTETGGTWDCSLIGTSGERGCFQIIPELHPDVDPMDFIASAEYFIKEYRAGRGWQWTGCSCVKSAKLTVKGLKGDADTYKPNADLQTGKIAIFEYRGVRHIAAYKITPTGLLLRKEGNFKPCVIKDRVIPWSELGNNLIGFYNPELEKN